MSRLDATVLWQSLASTSTANIEDLEVFASIASTNTHLLAKRPPAAGRLHVALADHQTSGRGRRDNRWVSPPGVGLCLSIAYTFAEHSDELASLTLATGVGIVRALEALGVRGAGLKWPNDIVLQDCKLGGVLTEVQSNSGPEITVVIGVGINVTPPADFAGARSSSWSHRPIGLADALPAPPRRESLAAALVDNLHPTLTRFEQDGFTAFAGPWRDYDWLFGKSVNVEAATETIEGIARGVDATGALIVAAGADRTRVVSGTVTAIGV